ncbi:MAG: DUF4358 domain-containing protein [Hydrogenoanaerobacterium sp.]
MKKLLTFLIAAAIAASMVACSTADKSSSQSVSSESSVSESSASSELSSEQSPEDFKIPEENKKLGDIINAARPAEFNEYYPAILSKDDPQAQMMSDVTGIKYDDMKAFALSASAMNTKAYAVAILQPAEGKAESVLKSANAFVEAQKKAFEKYLPDQKDIANAATVDTLDDGTVVLVMCEGSADVQKAILTALKK